jgi:hypothetical protein
MRDLGARLREVVRRARTPGIPTAGVLSVLPRELTYVPDPDPTDLRLDVAELLGGTRLDASGACVMVERRYEAHRTHGRRAVESYLPAAQAPLHLLDPRINQVPDWSRRLVYFDIETTGLSGGAGTIAFLVGCGWFDEEGFTVRQFFLAGPSGERVMLDALGAVLNGASLLVTYNGRTFDVPFMEMRWAFHRSPAATEDLPHFDMLPPARRLWSRRGSDPHDPLGAFTQEGCSLAALERRVLGFHRHGDVPGFEIPARYFHFLRSGDGSVIEGVLEHNRHDLLSLAAVMSQALWLAAEGPDACREPGEQVALGRLYEQAGLMDRAVHAYERAAAAGDRHASGGALGRLAVLLRRQQRYAEAADAWQGVLDLSPPGCRTLSPLGCRAAEALAIYHEHRARDLPSARRYASVLDGAVSGRGRLDLDRRMRRLDRKLDQRAGGRKGTLEYE